MMNRTKPRLLISLEQIRAHMSTMKKRTPSHYETLNVSKDSTQDEIKTAYYDLTKKYHPDRNTSDEAKTKFQAVSNAYEVLGNFHKRRLYDRDVSARGGAVGSKTNYPAAESKMSNFHKSRASNVHATKDTSTFRNYDFDAWTKAHYGNTLRKSLKSSKDYQEYKLRREQMIRFEQEQFTSSVYFTVFTIILISCFFSAQRMYFDYDVPVVNHKKTKNNEVKNINSEND